MIAIYSYKVPAPFRDCCKSGLRVSHGGRGPQGPPGPGPQGPGGKWKAHIVGYLHLSFHPDWGGGTYVVCRVLWVLGSFAKI